MNVILLERIEKLGQMGDVVTVKPGYARNYLLPSKKAMRATKENLAYFNTQRQQLEADNLQRRDEAGSVAEKLNGLKVSVIRSAGETGQLYGSVNARDIANAVTEAGFTVSRNQVVLDRPVKTLGLFDFRVRLHPEVDSTVTVNVARSAEEAAEQEKLGRAILSVAAEEEEADRIAAAAAAEAMFEPEAAEQVQAVASGIEEDPAEAEAPVETAAAEDAAPDSGNDDAESDDTEPKDA
ncbi:MAG: 50S ribosomal protein L9 [Alphaproteobacteria bacterium]|nr:50S ribosomal protein L9 [Alphaproteobacteria bacterium]